MNLKLLSKKEIEEIIQQNATKDGKIPFHNFIQLVIPKKFTIDYSDIEEIPKYVSERLENRFSDYDE
jgi:hypothetical protein